MADDFPKTQGSALVQVRDASGNLVAEYSGNPIAAELKTKDMDFDLRNAIKFLDAILFEVTEASLLSLVRVQVTFRDSLSDTPQELTPFNLDELDEFHFFREAARYFTFSIQSDSVGVFWRLGALEMFGTVEGRRLI